MLRLLIFAFTIVMSLSQVSNAEDNSCDTLYSQEKYDEALKYCLEEKKAFQLGYIYFKQNNCGESHRWYQEDGSFQSLHNRLICYMACRVVQKI